MMKMLLKSLLMLMACLLAGAATGGQKPPQKQESRTVAHLSTGYDPKSRSAAEDPAYVIGAEDVLTINVWKEPDISRTVPVRPDGKISLPLLNDVQAAGLTPLQLGAVIGEGLKKYISEPQVSVIVTTINSRRIYILGEVARPGAYPLLPNMTVLQALSTAGGFGLYANPKKVYVLRNVSGKPVRFPFNYKEVIAGVRPEQDIQLEPGDTIVVP